MAVIIGSARIDENGNIHGGQAGDQTGHEVETQEWYKHDLGWVVIRPKKKEVAEYIAKDMEYACDNPNVGYDQYQSNTLYNIVKPLGFDISKVVTPCETHCARLVRVGVAFAGVKCKIPVLENVPDFYTATETKTLENTGEFDILYDEKYCNSSDYLQRGDILNTRSQGHTVVVLTDGPMVGHEESPVAGDSTLYKATGAVYIRTGPSTANPSIGVIPKGAYAYVYSLLNGWAYCSYKGIEGYASLKYLTEVEHKYITTGNVWMRLLPSVAGFPITVIQKGTKLKGTGKTASVLGTSWYEVIYDGKTGWCSGKYIQKCS